MGANEKQLTGLTVVKFRKNVSKINSDALSY